MIKKGRKREERRRGRNRGGKGIKKGDITASKCH